MATFNALLDGLYHTDTVAQAVTRGSLIYGNSTPAWDELVVGIADSFLGSDGTDAAWTAAGALTRTNDTNVTLTLGGTPTTALLRAASLTLGWTGQLSVARGGTGAATLTGLLQGNGTGAISGVTNSSTVGQILRVIGASAYAWGALDLADTDAITGDLPYANLTPSSAASRILGRTDASAGDWQEITLGSGLSMSGTTISASGGVSSHDLLDGSVHPDTVAATVSRGSLIVGNATPAWDELPISLTPGDVLTSDGITAAWAAPAGGAVDADFVTYLPATIANWNAGVDPGDVDDALDQLAANLSPLLPPSAPALDDIDLDTANGASGKNTWNTASPITNYAPSPSDSAAGANALDSTMSASGNLHGVYDWDTFTSVAGTLNEDVAVHGGTPTAAYPADSFSPGGSDGGATNNLELYVNNVLIHTTNLLTHVSGSSLNGAGSGFTGLSAATPVKFSDGTSFTPRTYRTGGWIVVKADCGLGGTSTRGWSTVKVKHVTTAGTQTSDVHEYLLDDDNTATAYSAESISGYAGTGSKVVSGVTHHTAATATYNVTIDNAYRNTYKDGSPITYQVTNLAAVSAEALASSSGNEALQVVKAKAISASGTRLLNATLTARTTVDRTAQTDAQSTGGTVAGVLIDTVGATAANTVEPFDDEVFRMRSNLSLTAITPYVSGGAGTNSPAPWDNTLTLASGTNATGLLESNGQIQYPTQGTNAGDFGGITNGPAGNPNYSALTGNRTYLRYFYVGAGVQNVTFTLTKIAGTGFVSVATAPSGQNLTLEMLAPNTTQNGSATVEFKDCIVSYTTNDAIGCQTSSSGLATTTAVVSVTLGTRSTSTSGNVVVVRIAAAAAWTGNISNITVT